MELMIVRELINRLNDENILYCHWKSNQHVADAFTGIDDVDMLIDQEDLLKLNIVLNELGYKRFRLPEKRAYIGIGDYLGFDTKKGRFVHLHLHYQLTLGEKFLKGYQLPYSKEILNRRIYDSENKIYISSHEDEMWLLLVRLALKLRHRDLIKLIIKKDIFGKSTQNEYLWLKQNIDIDLFKKISQQYFGQDITEQLLTLINEKLNLKTVNNLNKLIRKRFRVFKGFTSIEATSTRWTRELFRIQQEIHKRFYKDIRSYRRTPTTGGKFIAFLGPDGAGKSTVINEACSRLQRMMDVQHIYLGSGDGQSSLVRKPLKVLYSMLLKKGTLDRKSKRIDEQGKVYREGEKAGAGIIRKIGQIPWTYTLSAERKRKIIKGRKFRNKGYVVISDRYPQTQFIDMCDGPKYYLNPNIEETMINRLLVKCEKECFEIANIAKPDIVIVLKVSSKEAYKRKPDEIDIDTHKLLMNSILEMDFGGSTKRVIIDADQELEKVILDVMEAIWESI